MTSLAIVFLAFVPVVQAANTLDIYTIDVEGGKSVLVVSPSGESMLIDAGWPEGPGRVASVDRIVETAKGAGLKQIDHLLISHFDLDHLGDVPQLTSKIPVRHIYDHGEFQPPPVNSDPQLKARVDAALERFRAYDEVRRKIGHTVLKPGDKVPIKGVDVEASRQLKHGTILGIVLDETGSARLQPIVEAAKAAGFKVRAP